MLWSHKISVFAGYDLISRVYFLNETPVTQTISLPPVTVSGSAGLPYVYVSGGSGYINNGIGSIGSNISTVYYSSASDSYFVDFVYDIDFLSLHGGSSFVATSSVMPDDADCYVVTWGGISPTFSSASSSGSFGSSFFCVPTLTELSVLIQGVEYPVSPGQGNASALHDKPMYYVNEGILRIKGFYSIRVTGGSGTSGIDSAVLVPSVTLSSRGLYYLEYFSSGDVTSQDIVDQTHDITEGFDSSSGNQAADQLGQELDNYLQAEDALYDQMQYDVPEIDLQADAQGILLASNFLQSLYVSDSFISKVITYVLSFGLILFIVGWLKKRDSG